MNALTKKNEAEEATPDNVVHLEEELGREQRMNRPSGEWNAAEVWGDLESPEAVALLAQPVVLGATTKAPRVAGDSWGRHEWTWRQAFDHLSHHPESADKGGNAFFFAESESARKKVNGVRQCYRLKDKIQRVYAVSIDVDGGCNAEDVRARVLAKGWAALIYTTHSNTTKGGPGNDRFRVILPLVAPYELGEGAKHTRDFQALYVGLCESFLPDGASWDITASRPSQIMYAPARPKGAKFKHYIVAGTGLDLSAVQPGDLSKYLKREPTGGGRVSAVDKGAPAFLSDGFDLRAWHSDCGESFLLSAFLEWIGWEVGGDAGDGFDLACPNAAEHSSEGAAWGVDGPEAKNGATIYCHHAHCTGLFTWDHLRMIEESGQWGLPDGAESFSAYLCNPDFYPDNEAPNHAEYVDSPVQVLPLKTAKSVAKAVMALPPNASEGHWAAIYAGVSLEGNRSEAAAKLDELAKAAGKDANTRKRFPVMARKLLEAHNAAFATERAAEEEAERKAVYTATVADNADSLAVSLDPSDPLGDTMTEALATLARRYAVVDLNGLFRVVRKPDLSAFGRDAATMVIYRKEDFVNLHDDRKVSEGDSKVNPASVFLETAGRKSGIVFAPPPAQIGRNDFNTYQGRKLKAKPGAWTTLQAFIFEVICKGDQAKYDWLVLWMAHLVQFPGEKPGTAVVCRGEGGTGKGTFGALLTQLAAPHVKTLSEGEHVLGRFAGEHLSKCILAIVNEALFGAAPQVAGRMKALVDSLTIEVEAKGKDVQTALSYLRLFIDSNEALPVLIEGNGSERRYFVMETSTAKQKNLEYFAGVRSAIEGAEMAALLDYLERYDPATAGLTWADVRTAPETAERRAMAWHSLRPPVRRLLDVLRDGSVTLRIEGMDTTITADKDGLKVPVAPFRDYIAAAGDKRRAEDSDVLAMFARLYPGAEVKHGQGKAGDLPNVRWWRFPPEVIGEGAETPKLCAD